MDDQTFTLSWDVDILKIRRVSKLFKTDPFVVSILNDTKWICFFIIGIQDTSSLISLHLIRGKDEYPDSISLKATFQLIGVSGTPGNVMTRTKIFEQTKGISFEVSLTCSEVERLYLRNDTLKIRCVLSKTDKELTTKTVFAHTTGDVRKIRGEWALTNFSQLSPGLIMKNTARLRKGDCLLFDICLFNEIRPCGDVIIFRFTSRCDTSFETMSLKFLITVLDNKLTESGIWKLDQHVFHMRTAEEVWEFPHVLKKAAFFREKNKYLSNDTLDLNCDIVLYLGTMTSKITRTALTMEVNHSQTVNHLTENMKYLFNSKRFADVELRAFGETVPAHKIILQSRSKTFAEMLDNVDGTCNDVLDVPDVDMITLKRMLKYMYTDEIEDLEYDEAVVAYIAAHKYWIESLKCKYSFVIQSHMNVTNVRSILLLADNFCDHDLTNCALDFLIQYWDAVRKNVLGI